jgi:flagellar hook-associated protein 1 FlgK
MSMGIKALAANYAALQTAGHNIANANVAGYSRQHVEFSTSQGQFTGAGFVGRGVDVATVARSHNEYLTREADGARSLAAMDGARLQQLRRLENVFKPGEMGLGYATSEFLSSMVDLSSRPGDPATRQVALARAGDLAARFSEAGSALDEVQAGVTAELRAAVAEVNSLAEGIAQANQRIAAQRGLGQPANDLLDERERLISQLSQHVQVSRIEAGDGTLAILVGGGQRLVLGVEAARLQVMQDASDPSRSAVGIADGAALRVLSAENMGAGNIRGLLRFQNDDLVVGQNLVGRLAAAVGGAVNEQQLRGLNLLPPLGQVPSSALFGMGAPQALANSANVRDANGDPLATITLTITDPAALQASEYDLREDSANPGTYVLTRLADGRAVTVASGDEVDGMRIDFGATPPQPGDRFLLQPVTRAAGGMQRLLDDPRDLAAASALIATSSPGNTGTARASSLQVTQAPLPTPGATTRITFTSDTGDYTWELFDASNALLASGSATWQAGQPVPTAPLDINGFTMQITGVPRSGDVLVVEPTPASALSSNNGNALALLALREAPIVDGRSASDAWALAMADVGVRVQGGKSAAAIATAVAAQSELARSSESGVNLDEEAARLIQYQQSYQAAAKVLQVAQSLFETMLEAAAR